MRAPFQILAIPYRIVDGTPMYCVFHRADHDQWQFIAGGGEDNETPLAAAKRETFEEGGVHSTQWLGLKSLSYIPVTIIVDAPDKSSGKRRQKVHIEYDLVGYIPVDELLKAEQA